MNHTARGDSVAGNGGAVTAPGLEGQEEEGRLLGEVGAMEELELRMEGWVCSS